MTSTTSPNTTRQSDPRAESSMPLLLRLEHILKTSGLCLDSPALLRWVVRGGTAQTLVLRFLRLKFSPVILERVRRLHAPLAERSELFTQAISCVNARETYKTTGLDRTRLADAAVLRHLPDVSMPRVLEAGVSDGVSCIRLLEALPKDAVVEISDRHPHLFRRGPRGLCLLADADGRLLGLKLPLFYLTLPLNLRRDTRSWTRIETINPMLPEALGIDNIRSFDMRTDRTSSPFHVIKCANVFNRRYFSDEVIRSAVANLAQSLVPGGILVISQNNARYAGGEAYFVLRHSGENMVLVEEMNGHEALELFAVKGKVS